MKSLLILVVVAAGVLTGCAPKRENVVLIVIDTLRADRLGCYGHDRPTSPFIDQLAKRGVLFEQTYASAPWTVPSTASLMTSLNARDHGCRHGVIPKDVYGVMGQELLPEEFETLAERMKSLGYRTYAASSNPHVSRETGFGQGFDEFKLLWMRDSPDVNRAIEEWSEELRGKSRQPWFLYIHYFDPHMPYIGREPWITDFAEGSGTLYKSYEGIRYDLWRDRFGEAMRQLGGDEGKIARYVQELRQGMLDLYDSEIAFVDQNIGQLFERLGIDLEQTTVIVTSDHGEEFFEHGLVVEHGFSLFEAVVRVPMIWSGPQVKAAPGSRIRTPVSNIDIFPTLAALNGGPGPKNAKAYGISLAAPLQVGSEPPERTLYLETERKSDAVLYLAMRDGAWKYTNRTDKDGSVLSLLINLYQDPAEKTNLVEVQRGLAERFSENMQTWNRENPPRKAERTQTHLDENRLREMRSLGYLK